MNYKVINDNNINSLKNYPDNYFDSIVTDPPYGLGKEPDASELMKDWLEKGYHEIKGTGFMGKDWDAFVPQPLFWKEVFRVLKPGGYCLAFYGTRTYDWGVMAMRFAGFEVRDCIQWLYGSGFPKSHNIALAIDKKEGIIGNRGKAINVGGKGDRNDILTSVSISNGTLQPPYKSENKWDGWGSALKPANEPIVLARKPLEKGLSIAENVLKWGTGGINIDGSRVSTEENLGRQQYAKTSALKCSNYEDKFFEGNPSGRFPANIILTHHPECDCKGLKVVKGSIAIRENSGGNTFGGNNKKPPINNLGYADENGMETVEDWNCHPDCPIKILDEQSENASRFFYVSKASKSERNKGLENNFHPTVKPIKLMQYLVKLVTPPNGIVLDPFCGSGTTGIACKLEGFEFVGIEQDAEYCKIAEARIKGTILEAKQNELF